VLPTQLERSSLDFGSKNDLRIRVLEKSGGNNERTEGGALPSLGEQFFLSTLSAEMQPVQRLLSEIAPTEIPVLVEGESGTGKEIVARQIHELSSQRGLPFLKFSCAAFAVESFQLQLRSFENGRSAKIGKSGGTLFFDEISELDANCQRHLLHLFPEENARRTAQSLGGRIVSCTTRDLESEVHGGRFRSELFYRLNGVCLRLPPLRKRKEDIPLLAQFFLNKYSQFFHRGKVSLSDRTLGLLVDYPWPGNIRELENVIKKIVALENEELAVSDLSARPSPLAAIGTTMITCSLKAAARAASQQAERELILQTLTRTHWNRKRAAAALQISYKALLYKLKQIRVPDSEEV
jgi:DNA-binding NtrC family response regulator